ncbi:MAG: sterol desaturase family protein [Bacteroidetes bacterium]|nr:sterol desaturase family protein [Bacteroidota bacterium]
MKEYYNIFIQSFTDYFHYLSNELLYPSWHNYFYWLLGLSLFIWLLEITIPWRKHQHIIRKDFWLDGFYMFFNFFLFSLIGFNAISNVFVNLFDDFIGLFGLHNIVAIEIGHWPKWAQLISLFIIADFIQWNIHRMLHYVPWMWEFHKVHHSVEQMGFAAHLRFHWMENIIYKTIQYIPLAMIGFGLKDFFIVHIIALSIGHINHSNLNISYGPFKYLLNNPKMHIWHHAKELPQLPYGANYGISLSIWDYIFKTDYIPNDGRDIELGFESMENFPKSFLDQSKHGFKK